MLLIPVLLLFPVGHFAYEYIEYNYTNFNNPDFDILRKNYTYCFDDVDVIRSFERLRDEFGRCLYIIPLRDDFLLPVIPDLFEPDADELDYFILNEIEERYGAETLNSSDFIEPRVSSFITLDKYKYSTDVLFFLFDIKAKLDNYTNTVEDVIGLYMAKHFINSEREDLEYYCYDHDSDMIPRYDKDHGCMFSFINNYFYIGPIYLNSYLTLPPKDVELGGTFYSVQTHLQGCTSNAQLLNTSREYISDGHCTARLNIRGFDVICCCYTYVHDCAFNALKLASTMSSEEQERESRQILDPRLSDDLFLCIRGKLNSTHQDVGSINVERSQIITPPSRFCYVIIRADFSETVMAANISYTLDASNGNDGYCNETDMEDSLSTRRIYHPTGYSVYNYSIRDGGSVIFCCRGHFCNHYRVHFKEAEYENVFRTFELIIPENLDSGCGYFPLFLSQTLQEDKTLKSCFYSVSLSDLTDLSLDNVATIKNSKLYYPLEHSVGKENILCYFFKREDSKLMYFGCELPKITSFKNTHLPNFAAVLNSVVTSDLRRYYLDHTEMSRCLDTAKKSVDLMSLVKMAGSEYSVMMTHLPFCYTIMYTEGPFIQINSGKCMDDLPSNLKKCCDFGVEMKDQVNIVKMKGLEIMPVWYTSKNIRIDSCDDGNCFAGEINAKCMTYFGLEPEGKLITQLLFDDSSQGFQKGINHSKKDDKHWDDRDGALMISKYVCSVDKTTPKCSDAPAAEILIPLFCVTKNVMFQHEACKKYTDNASLKDYRLFFLCFTLPQSQRHSYYREFIVLNGITPFLYKCSLR